MADSLTATGQLSPLLVRHNPDDADRYQIIYGNRRLAAARKLGWKKIRCVVSEISDTEAMISAFCENIDRKQLSDYEIALFLERLHAQSGKTYAELADLIKKSRAFVSQHIAMLYLFPGTVAAEDERKRILHGLTERHARALSKIENVTERWNTAKLAVRASLGIREIERMCSSLSRGKRSVTSKNHRSKIEKVIQSVFSQFSQKNPSLHFEAMSERFTMLARFQPFHEMDKEEAKDFVCEFLRGADDLKVQVDSTNCRIIGNIAISTVFSTYSMKASGRRLSSKTRTTFVLKHENDSWKVIHEHWSSADNAEMLPNLAKKFQLFADATFQEIESRRAHARELEPKVLR